MDKFSIRKNTKEIADSPNSWKAKLVYNSRIPFFIANSETNSEKLEKYTKLLKHENWVKWEFSYEKNWKLGKSWRKIGNFSPKFWITKLERIRKFHFFNLGEIMTKDCKMHQNLEILLLLKFQSKLTKNWKFSINSQKPKNWAKLNGFF